ncbi:MAG: DUF2298 domain-containing protein, partial [Thermomicrobium sp.]|nr:DUF2298 domain-containing protein [Thermomicrobium sp.]
MSDLLVTSLWHVVWLLCAFAILPALMLRSTDERLAAVIAIAAGVALIVLPVWWLGTLFGLPFSRGTLFASWVAVALLGWGSIVRRRDWSALSRLARSTWPFVIAHSLAFTSYLLFRSYAPAIRYTEKPMELAFLSSSIGSSRLPSPDPWFTGYPINYYAFGYVQMAAVAKVIGVEPERAFNLALASLFAGALVTVTATAGRLAARDGGQFRWSAALLAGLLLVGVGNWQTAWQFLRDPLGTLHASWWAGPGWNASRVIVDAGFPWDGAPRPTINEFPAFSFVLGDLHPHVLALPLLGAYLASLTVFPDQKRPMLGAVLPGVLFGCLWVTNTWAVPLAGLVAALVFVTRPWP